MEVNDGGIYPNSLYGSCAHIPHLPDVWHHYLRVRVQQT